MRLWKRLCIAAISMLFPTSLYGQSEPVAQAGNTAAATQTQKTTPCRPASKSPETPITPSLLSSNFKSGETLIVRLNNQRERVGKLSEIQSDYFLLTSSTDTEKIAYKDAADVRKLSAGWRVKKILMFPIKPPLYAAVWIAAFLDWTVHR